MPFHMVMDFLHDTPPPPPPTHGTEKFNVKTSVKLLWPILLTFLSN